jgi:D-sedoheptulose 7-phosphate isomerase
MRNRLVQLFEESTCAKSFAIGYLDYLIERIRCLDCGEIEDFIGVLSDAQREGRRVFFIGNGGSAATASHFANDLSIGTRSWEMPLRAVALTDNVAILTAIANDYGYDDVFRLQLTTQAQKGDVVVAISASGNSPNLLQAVEYANQASLITVGLTGFDGGTLKKLTQFNVHVDSGHGEYGPVEDLHMVLDHLVGTYLMLKNRGEP